MFGSTSHGGRIAAVLRSGIIAIVAYAAMSSPAVVRAEDAEESNPTRGALLERTRQKIRSVHELIDAKEPEKALVRLEQLGSIVPDAERLYLQGRALLLQGEHLKARTKFRGAIQKSPRYGEFHYWLGITYQEGGAHALAVSALNQAVLKGLETAAVQEALAISLMATDDVLGEIARQTFELPAEPWHVPGGIGRDGVLVSCVDPEANIWVVAPRTSALFHAQQATEIDPQRGMSWLVAGEVWSKAGFHDVATLRFIRAAELLEGRDLSRCHQRWAECLFAVADYDGYIEHCKQSIKAAPDAVDFSLADAYSRAAAGHALVGDTDAQVTCLKFACELAPTVDRHLRLADALIAMQRHDEASVKLRDALAMDPTRTEKRLINQRLLQVAQAAMPGLR